MPIYFKALLGKVEDAANIMLNYNQIIEQYGVPPEFYNLPNREAVRILKIIF